MVEKQSIEAMAVAEAKRTEQDLVSMGDDDCLGHDVSGERRERGEAVQSMQ